MPTLKNPERWSSLFRDFISVCLVRDPEKRYTAQQLLNVVISFPRSPYMQLMRGSLFYDSTCSYPAKRTKAARRFSVGS